MSSWSLSAASVEVLLGVLLVIPRTTRPAAWGLIALLIAVFPANIYAYQHQEIFPDVSPSCCNWPVCPSRPLFILWAWWYTGEGTLNAER